jgi:hypothetical protein
VDLYEQYPVLQRVKSILNSVQNTEKSTGNAQYRILKTPQRPGPRARFGPYMNKFNWSALKNDQRLTPVQKKTVEKILVSLQVPARDRVRNRPRLNFNIKNKKFLKANGTVNIAKLNTEVRSRLPKERNNSNSSNVRVNRPNVRANNAAAVALRQHREAYGE